MISIEQLTAEKFAPFGDVIDYEDPHDAVFLDDTTDIVSDVACIDATSRKGRAQVDILRLTPQALPVTIASILRNQDATTPFLPAMFYPFLTIVSESHQPPESKLLRAFMTNGQQGVNLRAGVWHHRPIAMKRRMMTLQLTRSGQGEGACAVPFKAGVLIGG